MEIRPEITHGIVNRKVGSIFGYQGWPSVCRDENGTLYAVASGFRTHHIDPFGKTVMYISKNSGETWTPPIVINDTFLDDRDAGILYLGNGKMLVTWFSHPASAYTKGWLFDGTKNCSFPEDIRADIGLIDSLGYINGEEAHGGSFIRISEDYGITWGETVKVPISSPHGPNLLRDGSLLYLGKEMYSDGEAPEKQICAYGSSDGGHSWQHLSTLGMPKEIPLNAFHEPHVIELPDGKLFGAIRAQGSSVVHEFTIYTTLSEDGGKSWTEPICTDVSGSPPHLMLHSSGVLLCSYGRREKPYGERVMASYDLGKTWEDDYILDEATPDGDLGYPASVELDDGSIMTVYYQKYPGDAKCSILYSRWRLK